MSHEIPSAMILKFSMWLADNQHELFGAMFVASVVMLFFNNISKGGDDDGVAY